MGKLFDFRANYSDTILGFSSRFSPSQSINIAPNCAVDVSSIQSGANLSRLTPIEDFRSEILKKQFHSIYLQRTFSLGDVLLLIPIVRYLQKQFPNISFTVRTINKFFGLLRPMDVPVLSISGIGEMDGALRWDLDWTVEKEHTNPRAQKVPRPNIYMKALTMPEAKWGELNWDCDMSRFPKMEFDGDYIAFQGMGNAEIRGLPIRTIQYIIRRLNKQGIKVVYLGRPLTLKVDEKMTRLQFMKSTLPELFGWIGGAKAVISMDSSPLWISYFTKTPLIAILNATWPEKRIELHPLRPNRAVAISTAREIDCCPCFELAKKCNHKFYCRKIHPKKLWGIMEPYIIEFMKS